MMDPIAEGRRFLGVAVAILIALTTVYVSGPFSAVNEGLQLVGGIAASVVVTLLLNPLAGRQGRGRGGLSGLLTGVDLVVILGFLYAINHFFETYENLWNGIFALTVSEVLTGLMAILILLEAVRRCFGIILPAVCLLIFSFALWGGDLPGILGHRGYDVEDTVTAVWFSFDGVFGRVTGLVASIVLVFIVFGAVLEATRASDVLLKFAIAFTAGIRGGSAHAAIVSSAMFGTISGSSVANVVGTGVFTIPMIKRQGFSPKFAGAVEAGASAAGQFTPPIMGAVGFILAEMVGQPYYVVAIAAVMPAFFYYFALFASVYAEAVRLGIEPLPEGDRPVLEAKDWLQALRFVIPMAAVVAVLLWGRSPAIAGFMAIVVAIAVAALLDALSADARAIFADYPNRYLAALKRGGTACAQIMAAVGAIGIVIAVVKLTGVAGSFGAVVSDLAQGSRLLALLVTMLGCLLLGLGLPTVPAYLFIILFVGPVFADLGTPVLLVHMFVLYFGVLSNITPPVAIAAYAAAPIAGANPIATGFAALRIAFPGFLIPFVFVYNPSLTLVVEFGWLPFAWIFLRLLIAVWLIATAFVGCDRRAIFPPERALRFGLAIAVLIDLWAVQLAGVLLALAVVAIHRRQVSPSRPAL